VVGDREHIDASGRRRHDRLRPLRSVAPQRVHVQIGSTLSLDMECAHCIQRPTGDVNAVPLCA
jgi:hypothetical protein